jgi:branched-chain amino acid transport system permease protein
METKPLPVWQQVVRYGLIAGAAALLLSLVGIVEAFSLRDIIYQVISTGHVMLLAPMLAFGYATANKIENERPLNGVLLGLITGLVGGAVLVLFVLLGQVVNLRSMFINASPTLYQFLRFGDPSTLGLLKLIVASAIAGGLGASFLLLPIRLRNSVAQASLWVVLIGLIRDLLVTVISNWGPVEPLVAWMFARSGLSLLGAVVLFVLVGVFYNWRFGRQGLAGPVRTPEQARAWRLARFGVLAIILLLLPQVLGIFFSEILDNVGLYILMGLGLNIVVGFAGLLDLGYVAFYAIGAYTMGVLTSPELGFANLTYWQALPFALIASVLAGILLGLPVLRLRGDYLAIVTLGFGEIVRLLALSDWLAPYLGGSQGIQVIARPRIGSIELATQQQLYYLILAGIAIAGFIALRLKDSRLGRSWMALREDEDVAMAMGINHVSTKLLAFATGAFFAGLAGTIFAAKLTSAYPHSFNLLVSIIVLSLIIVGGMGSIPGVFVGALALVGLPELLREFAEFRYWVYGAVLITMMLVRPEGLWPEERRKLELHEEEAPLPEELSPATTGAD